MYWPRGAVSLGAVGARTACVWSRGRRRTKLRTGVRDFRHGTSSGDDDDPPDPDPGPARPDRSTDRRTQPKLCDATCFGGIRCRTLPRPSGVRGPAAASKHRGLG